MSSTYNLYEDDDELDHIVLGGVRSPGKCTLSGHDRKANWDVKAGQGQIGASTTLKDIPLIEFTATFYLTIDPSATDDEEEEMYDFLELVESTVSGPKPKALDIYHPDLADQDITSVVKASIGGATYDGKGGKTYVVKFQEYKAPKPKGGSPSGSSSKAGPNAPDPNAAANAEIAKLTAEYKATPWG